MYKTATETSKQLELREWMNDVALYARMEIARKRYSLLLRRLTGWRGILLFACLGVLLLVASVGAKPVEPPRVTQPYAVEVTLAQDAGALEPSLKACAGNSFAAVAVGGTLSEPDVVTSSSNCGSRFTITRDVGVAVPVPQPLSSRSP